MDEHPYRGVEEDLRSIDDRLRLVFNDQYQCWQVLQVANVNTFVTPSLRGVPGIDGKSCNYFLVFNLWDSKQRPLDPEAFSGRICMALHYADVEAAGGLNVFMDAMDKANEELGEDALKKKHREHVDAARAFHKKYKRIISSPEATVNIEKAHSEWEPEEMRI